MHTQYSLHPNVAKLPFFQHHKLFGPQQTWIRIMGAGSTTTNISSIQPQEVSCQEHQRVYTYQERILMTPHSIGFWITMVFETVIVETNKSLYNNFQCMTK